MCVHQTGPGGLCAAQPARLTVAEVISANPHPKAADKLRVCEVNTSYARFKVGMD